MLESAQDTSAPRVASPSVLLQEPTAGHLAYVESPRVTRMMWYHDVAPMRFTTAPLRRLPYAEARHQPRRSGEKPSHFVSSLRAPSGRAGTVAPPIPRPLVSEAARLSLNVNTRTSRAASVGHQAYVSPMKRQASTEFVASSDEVEDSFAHAGTAQTAASNLPAQDTTEEEETDALTWPEFKRAVTHMIPTQKPRTDVHLRTWFDALDRDGDKRVDFEQFLAVSIKEAWVRANRPSEMLALFHADLEDTTLTIEDRLAFLRTLGFGAIAKAYAQPPDKLMELQRWLHSCAASPKAQALLIAASRIPGGRWCLAPLFETTSSSDEPTAYVDVGPAYQLPPLIMRVQREEPILLPRRVVTKLARVRMASRAVQSPNNNGQPPPPSEH